MRFLHTGDWHFGATKAFTKNLWRQRRAISRMCSYLKANDIDTVLIAGDLLHNSHALGAEKDILISALQALRRAAQNIFIISGNHDSGRTRGYNGLQTFLQLGEELNCKVFLEPTLYEAECYTITAIPAGFSCLHAHPPQDSRQHILLYHGPVYGAKTPSSFTFTEESLPTASQLKKLGFDYVALGDIHLQQKLASNVWYCGSPVEHVFEKGSVTGFLDVTLEEGKPTVKRIPIDAPRLVEVEVDASSPFEVESKTIRGHFVRLVVRGRLEDNGFTRREVVQHFRRLGSKETQLVSVPKAEKTGDALTETPENLRTLDLTDLFQQFLAQDERAIALKDKWPALLALFHEFREEV